MNKGKVIIWLVAVALLAGCGKDSTKPRRKSEAQVVNDLKEIGIALHNFHGELGHFPYAGPMVAPRKGHALDLQHTPWRISVLAYIEEETLYKAILNGNYKGGKEGGEYWRDANLLKLCPKLYAAGLDDADRTRTRYRVFIGNGAAFDPNHCLRSAFFADGLSNTILVVEAEEAVPWTSTQELTYDPKKPLPKLGHPSRKGFHALMADGSVRYIPKNTDEKLIRAMITRNGFEEIKKLPGEEKCPRLGR